MFHLVFPLPYQIGTISRRGRCQPLSLKHISCKAGWRNCSADSFLSSDPSTRNGLPQFQGCVQHTTFNTNLALGAQRRSSLSVAPIDVLPPVGSLQHLVARLHIASHPWRSFQGHLRVTTPSLSCMSRSNTVFTKFAREAFRLSRKL